MGNTRTVYVRGTPIEVANPAIVDAIDRQTAAAAGRAKVTRRRPANIESVRRLQRWVETMRTGPGVFIPIYLRNPLNRKQHWRQQAKDVKSQRAAAFAACVGDRVEKRLPVKIKMTRYGPQPLDPTNVGRTLKAVEDGVADYFGPKDNDPRYTWLPPEQEKSPPGCYGVRIEFDYPPASLAPSGGRGAAGDGVSEPTPPRFARRRKGKTK